MTAMEFLVFEILCIMAGWISVNHLSAMSVLCSLYSTLMSFPMGLSLAVCMRIGSCLGMSEPTAGKKFAATGFRISVAMSLLIILMIVLTRNLIPIFFTSDTKIAELITLTLPFMALAYFPDSIQISLCGVIKGMGL